MTNREEIYSRAATTIKLTTEGHATWLKVQKRAIKNLAKIQSELKRVLKL